MGLPWGCGKPRLNFPFLPVGEQLFELGYSTLLEHAIALQQHIPVDISICLVLKLFYCVYIVIWAGTCTWISYIRTLMKGYRISLSYVLSFYCLNDYLIINIKWNSFHRRHWEIPIQAFRMAQKLGHLLQCGRQMMFLIFFCEPTWQKMCCFF